MDEKTMGGCTGSCHSCGSSCDTGEKKPSFFDRMERASEAFDEIGEDEIIRILNETVAQMEAEEAAENENK